MRTRKAFFAKVLAAAIAITTVLPSSLLAQAAIIETADTPVTEAETTTSNWSTPLGPKVNEGGEETWRFKAGEGDGNGNSDYSVANAAAVLYASGLDMSAKMPTAVDNDSKENLKFNYSVYTEKGSWEKMKFGIMVEYVDPTHWLYVGYDWMPHNNVDGSVNNDWLTKYPTHGHWYYEYNLGNGGGYADIKGLIRNKDVEDDDTKGIDLKDDMFRNIEIEYMEDGISLTVKQIGQVDPETGVISYNPHPRTEVVKLVDKDYTLKDGEVNDDNVAKMEANVLDSLANYQPAKQDGKDYGRFMGFKISNGSTMNIRDVTTNYEELGSELKKLDHEAYNWKWVKDYAALDIAESRRPSFTPGVVVGGRNYMLFNAASSQSPSTDYLTNVTEFKYGTVTADLRSDITGKEPEADMSEKEPKADKSADMTPAEPFYLSARYDAASGKDVAVGWNGANWVYRIGGQTVALEDIPLKAELKKDYRISMTIDHNKKLSASVTPVVEGAAGEETPLLAMTDASPKPAGMTDPAPVADDVAAGSIAVTTGAESVLYIRNLSYEKKDYTEATDLKNTYDDVTGASKANLAEPNKAYKYFTEAWTTFATAMGEVKAVIDSAEPISQDDATTAKNKATTAWNTLQNNEVKASAAYTAFKTVYDKADEIGMSDPSPYLDTDGSWTAFKNAKTAADAFVNGLSTTGYANEAALQTAIDTIDLANKYDGLKKEATAEEKSELQDAVDAAKEFLEKENKDYYTQSEWEAYEDAYNEAKELLASTGTITDKDVAAKLKALNDAKTLAPAEATDAEIGDFNKEIAGIESAVSGKFTETESYKKALADAKALGADDASPTKKELAEALAALKAEQAKLAPVTTDETPKQEPILTPNQQITDAAAPGMTFTVTDTANKTVELTTATVSSGKVAVPATVKTADGIECKVTSIAANAFTAKNSAKMTQITVGDNVETIKKNAFNGCKKLKTVIIGANVKSIEKNAFNNCGKIQTVTFKGAKLPSMKKNSFNKVKTKASKIVVKVNKSLIKKAAQKKSLANKMKKYGLKVSPNKIKKA